MMLIDRDAALNFEMELEAKDEEEMEAIAKGVSVCLDYIKSLPTINPASNGKWVKEECRVELPDQTPLRFTTYRCTNCGANFSKPASACPKCGTIMREPGRAECVNCGGTLIWDNDYDGEDVGDRPGIVHMYHCNDCGANIACFVPEEEAQ